MGRDALLNNMLNGLPDMDRIEQTAFVNSYITYIS